MCTHWACRAVIMNTHLSVKAICVVIDKQNICLKAIFQLNSLRLDRESRTWVLGLCMARHGWSLKSNTSQYWFAWDTFCLALTEACACGQTEAEVLEVCVRMFTGVFVMQAYTCVNIWEYNTVCVYVHLSVHVCVCVCWLWLELAWLSCCWEGAGRTALWVITTSPGTDCSLHTIRTRPKTDRPSTHTHTHTHIERNIAAQCMPKFMHTLRHLVLQTRSLTVKVILKNPLLSSQCCACWLSCWKPNKWYIDFNSLGLEFNGISNRLNKFSKTHRTDQSMTVLKRWEGMKQYYLSLEPKTVL